MTLVYIALVLIIILVAINIYFNTKKATDSLNTPDLKYNFLSLDKAIEKMDGSIKNEFQNIRSDNSTASKNTRDELSLNLKNFGETLKGSIDSVAVIQSQQLNTFSEQLGKLTASNEQKFESFKISIESKLLSIANDLNNNGKADRKELKDNLNIFKDELNTALKDFGDRQRHNFQDLNKNYNDQNKLNNQKLSEMNVTIEKSIKSLQDDNSIKLEKMRETVDEKLQKTLETRLGESFKLVSERLEAVHKGLGDMQQLATGVGDLKRVLTNVKTRGVLGEYQLENILEQLLTPEQYDKNVKTKLSSNGMVEFAVKLPAKENKDQIVYLPIDSKFPKEDFEVLMNAYDNGSVDMIEECRKTFIKGIKKCASDICSKYIDPPNTTDFAILFLPFESLYAEVLRTPGLFESIQKECKIIITGPTTLSALLSSLQMGFRTLVIEKRSSEVWQLLSAVKTEFGSFGKILEKTNKKLQEASNTINEASVRSRAIERKLTNVQQLPQTETGNLIDAVVVDVIGEDNDDI